MKFAIFVLIFGAPLTQAVVVDCEFRLTTWVIVKEIHDYVYTCLRPYITGTGEVTEIRGTPGHYYGQNDSTVEALWAMDSRIFEFPVGLGNFFPNLKVFVIYNSNLRTISSEALKFPKLLYFAITYDRIQTLDGNLFANTPNLVQINVNVNEIEHIGHDLLTGLYQLKEVSFERNDCVSMKANTTETIQELNRQLPISCPPLATETTTVSTTTEPSECECDDQINSVNDKLMEIIRVQEKRMTEIAENYEKRINMLEKQVSFTTSSPFARVFENLREKYL
jgi:hypothetical protein